MRYKVVASVLLLIGTMILGACFFPPWEVPSADKVAISGSPLAGRPPLVVTFTASVTKDGDYAYYAKTKTVESNFHWDFGDGTEGVGATVQHTYPSSGYYEATLTVFDEGTLVGMTKTGVLVSEEAAAAYLLQSWEEIDHRKHLVPGRLEVKFEPGTTLKQAIAVLSGLPLQIVGWIEALGLFEVMLDDPPNTGWLIQQLEDLPQVLEVGRSYLCEYLAGPPVQILDEEHYRQLDYWNILRAELGRSIEGDHLTNIAVFDSGYDTDHPELENRVYCKWAQTGLSIEDTEGHGTVVLGLMAAAAENGQVKGLAPWWLRFIVIKTERNPFARAVGINKAIALGANVINMSWGSPFDIPISLRDACQEAHRRNNVLLIAAVGNDGAEGNYYYPAAFDTVLAVGATDMEDNRASLSNYHESLVYAPGKNLYTAARGGDCEVVAPEGATSYAAPIVSVLAGMIYSVNPGRTNDEIYQIIRDTCDPISFAGVGRINYYRAMSDAKGSDPGENTLPNPVSNLEATSWETGIGLKWDYPGDTDIAGVRIYRETINSSGSNPLHLVATAEDVAGDNVFTDTYVTEDQLYRYYVFSVDTTGQMSVSWGHVTHKYSPPSEPGTVFTVHTEHYFQPHTEEHRYYLDVDPEEGWTIEDVIGPNIAGEEAPGLIRLTQRPEIGDTYTITARCIDGAVILRDYAVTGVNDSLPEITNPQDFSAVSTTRPTFSWVIPANSQSQAIAVLDSSENEVWRYWPLPAGTSFIQCGVALQEGEWDTVHVHSFDGNGNQASTYHFFQIQPIPGNQSPVADFRHYPKSGAAPLTVWFSDRSYDPDGSIVGWKWHFGDGSSKSTEQNPTHVYNVAPETYYVTLTVGDEDGATDSLTKTVTINNHAPVGMFAIISGFVAGDEVLFHDRSYDLDPLDYIAKWEWTVWGERSEIDWTVDVVVGQKSTTDPNDKDYRITLTRSGIYKVQLKVTDSHGMCDERHRYFHMSRW